jgi:hypothetical protein
MGKHKMGRGGLWAGGVTLGCHAQGYQHCSGFGPAPVRSVAMLAVLHTRRQWQAPNIAVRARAIHGRPGWRVAVGGLAQSVT